MKIIACGDSFTSGDEVIDDLLYSDFPGYTKLSYDNCEVRYKWHLATKGPRSRRYATIIPREQLLSYPAQLSQILRCDVANLGNGGASQIQIGDSLIRGIVAEQKAGTKMSELIVTINFTSPNRFMVPIYHKWASIILGHIIPAIHNKEYQAYERLYTLNTTEIMLYEAHAMAILQSVSYLRSLNIKYVLVDSVFGDDIMKFVDGDDSSDLLRGCWKQILEGNEILSMKKVAEDRDIQDVWCPGNHFSKYVHYEFAKALADRLTKL